MMTLEHVTKKYGRHVALEDVSMTVRPGQIVGILGRNGAGKTTAMNLMTGYFPPDSGRVAIDGMDMMEHPGECKRKIGYLPEKPPLYDEMTVERYLSFVCDLREVARQGKTAHIQEILAICSLEEMGRRLIGHLSKGYRQRVGIAQALCGNPEILILDEPTVGLDPMQVVEMRELIRKLGEEHTVVLSSHILGEVQQLCDSAVILHEGRLIRSFDLRGGEKDGTVRLRMKIRGRERELLEAIRSIGCVTKAESAGHGENGTAVIRIEGREKNEKGLMTDQIFHLMAAMDAPIRGMEQERDDLESAFLEATAN